MSGLIYETVEDSRRHWGSEEEDEKNDEEDSRRHWGSEEEGTTEEDEEDEEGDEEESRRGSEQEDDEEDEEGDKEESRRASEDRAWKRGGWRPKRKRAKCERVRRGEYSCKECGGRVQMALPPQSLHDCFCLPHGKRKNIRKECGGKAAQCPSHSQGTSETKRGYVRGKRSFHWQRWATGDKVKVVGTCLPAGFVIKVSELRKT
jgi:hypothetical protein